MTGKSNKQVKTETVWKQAVPDKTKRVAYGCKIEPKNIIPNKTRPRKDFNYKIFSGDYSATFSDEEENVVDAYVYPIQEVKPRKSYNNCEKRIERYDPHDEDSVKELSAKIKKMRLRKKKESGKSTKKSTSGRGRGRPSKKTLKARDENKEEEHVSEAESEEVISEDEEKEETLKETVKEAVKEAVAEVVEEKLVATPKKSRKNRRKSVKAKQGLTKKALKQLKDLGLTYTVTNTARTYKNTEIPKTIQQFLDHKTPKGSVVDSLGFTAFEFTGEFLLSKDEMDDFKFLRETKDAILIGDGDNLLVARLSDKSTDFNVYVLDDEEPEKVQGPYKLSNFLEEANIGEAPEEEEEDMDQE